MNGYGVIIGMISNLENGPVPVITNIAVIIGIATLVLLTFSVLARFLSKDNGETDRIGEMYKEKALDDEVVEAILLTRRTEDHKRAEYVVKSLAPLEKNAEKYLDKLQRNSIVNLFIGIIATIIAIGVLLFTILYKTDYKDIWAFSLQFLPRLTFVVFIQVFAFFFLRLYKNNLEDARYFQNELTNINCKIAAIKVAQVTNRDELLDSFLTSLIAVERNFKLAKEETMLNLEKARIEKEFDMQAFAIFKEFNVFRNLLESEGKSSG